MIADEIAEDAAGGEQIALFQVGLAEIIRRLRQMRPLRIVCLQRGKKRGGFVVSARFIGAPGDLKAHVFGFRRAEFHLQGEFVKGLGAGVIRPLFKPLLLDALHPCAGEKFLREIQVNAGEALLALRRDKLRDGGQIDVARLAELLGANVAFRRAEERFLPPR